MSETVLGGLKWTWENRAEIAARLKEIHRWWKRSRVLLIGPGGTGKTTLARVLAGEINWLVDAPWEYSESYAIDRLRMGNGLNAEMVVTPGQREHRPATWSAVERELAAGSYRGVILVSAYGHHTIPRNDLRTLFPGLSKAQALSQYLDGCRADELAVLDRVSRAALPSPKKLWLLSVVTKQDLWHDEEQAVEAHYRSGDYADRLRQLTATRGQAQSRNDFAFVSLLIGNYNDGRGNRLLKNVAGYDQRMQLESIRRLLHVIGELMKWEKER